MFCIFSKKNLLLIVAVCFITSCKKETPHFSNLWGRLADDDYIIPENKFAKQSNTKSVPVIAKKAVKTKKNVSKSNTKKVIKNKKPVAVKKAVKKTVINHNKVKQIYSNSYNVSKRQIIIGAANPGSRSYGIAGKLCRFINIKNKKLRCLVEPLPAILSKSVIDSKYYDFVISKSNIDEVLLQKHYNFKSMFSLYPEAFTILASKKSGINKVSDIKNKKVYIASNGVIPKSAFLDIIKEYNISKSDVEFATGLGMNQALCNGDIDVVFADIHHPSSDINEFLRTCGVKIIPIDKNVVSKLTEKRNAYFPVEIDSDTYYSMDSDIASFGIMINLLATNYVDEKLAGEVASIFFENMQEFKLQDTRLLDLTPSEMVKINEGLIFPIHQGALKYYKKKGLL